MGSRLIPFMAHNEIVLQRKSRSLSGRDGHRLTRCRLEPVANDPNRALSLISF
jgi:hypothetical protein